MSTTDPTQTICSDNETYSDWRKWCRLCAKCDAVGNINVFQANSKKVLNATLAAAIGKYFWVNIKIDDSLSRELCKECHTLMNELILFAERVNKVQAMFCVLENIGDNASIDPNDVRKQYGLLDEEWEHIIKSAKETQAIHKRDNEKTTSCEEAEEEEQVQDEDIVEQIVEYDTVEYEEEDELPRTMAVKAERDDELLSAKHTNKELSKPNAGTFIIKNKSLNSEKNERIELENDEREIDLQFMLEEDNVEEEHGTYNCKSEDERNARAAAFICDLCSKKCKNAESFRLHLIRVHSKSSEPDYKEEIVDDDTITSGDMKETEFEVEFVSDTEEFNEDENSDADNYNEEITNNTDNSGDQSSQNVSCGGRSNPRKRRTRNSSLTDHYIKVSKTNNDSLSTKEPRYHCDICNKPYKSPACYKKHMFDAHNKEANIIDLPCDKCGQSFFTEKQLAAHMRKHLPTSAKLDFECSYCEKRFTTIGALRQHVSGIHFDEKPFICDECGKPLRTMAALNEHKLVHTDDKPVECEVCGKGFKNKARMKVHMDTHASTEYTCNICGLGLNTRRTLKMHMLVHTDEKNYKCTFCPSEFKRSKALKNHLILHTGLRPYVCNFCKKTFSNGSNCRAHKKKVHPIELAKEEKEGKRAERIPVPNLNELRDSTHIINPRKVTRTGGLSHHMRALLIAAEKREKRQNSSIVKDESETMDTMESYVVETEEYSTIITDCQTDEDDVGETIIYEVIDTI